ncbi:MAG: insulinase family protein [Deltaproteobacteria bacterium]|nr:insulinase family protein [Deltaproteobacteria bacterium]
MAAAVLGIIVFAVFPAWGGDPPKVLGTKQTLPNGLVWLHSQQSGLPLVTMQLLVKAGVLQEPAAKAGLANLTAQLLLSGTQKRSAAQVAQELDFLGARLRAAGGDDFATVSLTVVKKDLAQGLELLKDVLFNPAFAPAEVKRTVAQIHGSLEADEDEPGVVASRSFARQLYGPFPYGRPVKGAPEGLRAITPKDLKDFHRRFYRPNNSLLSVAGDLTLEEAQRWVAQTFGSWRPETGPAPALPPIPALDKSKVTVINKDISQANIVLGNLGLARSNPDFYAVQVMNYIFGGGGFSSRLVEHIREKRGLAYHVRSDFSPGLEPGPFVVTLETKNPSAREAVDLVLGEMARMRNEPVAAQELEAAKSYLIGSFPRKMDSLDKRAGLMAYVEFYGLGLGYPWRFPDLIQGLTAADIQLAAQKYLHPDKYLLVVVGKQSEMPSLTGLTPGGKEEKQDEPKKSGN